MIVRTSLDSLSDCLRVFVCRAVGVSLHWTCTCVRALDVH